MKLRTEVKRYRPGYETWRRWHDPKAKPTDYDRWRKQHQVRVRKAAIDMLDKICDGNPQAMDLIARQALSPKTVKQYIKDRRVGPRGPFLTTYLALRGRVS